MHHHVSAQPTAHSQSQGAGGSAATQQGVGDVMDEEELERQYNEYKKQFEQWRDANKEHPDKTAFQQYEQQWKSWEAQVEQRRQLIRAQKQAAAAAAQQRPAVSASFSSNLLASHSGIPPVVPGMPYHYSTAGSMLAPGAVQPAVSHVMYPHQQSMLPAAMSAATQPVGMLPPTAAAPMAYPQAAGMPSMMDPQQMMMAMMQSGMGGGVAPPAGMDFQSMMMSFMGQYMMSMMMGGGGAGTMGASGGNNMMEQFMNMMMSMMNPTGGSTTVSGASAPTTGSTKSSKKKSKGVTSTNSTSGENGTEADFMKMFMDMMGGNSGSATNTGTSSSGFPAVTDDPPPDMKAMMDLMQSVLDETQKANQDSKEKDVSGDKADVSMKSKKKSKPVTINTMSDNGHAAAKRTPDKEDVTSGMATSGIGSGGFFTVSSASNDAAGAAAMNSFASSTYPALFASGMMPTGPSAAPAPVPIPTHMPAQNQPGGLQEGGFVQAIQPVANVHHPAQYPPPVAGFNMPPPAYPSPGVGVNMSGPPPNYTGASRDDGSSGFREPFSQMGQGSGREPFPQIGQGPGREPYPQMGHGYESGREPFSMMGQGSGGEPFSQMGQGSGGEPFPQMGQESGREPFSQMGQEFGREPFHQMGQESGGEPFHQMRQESGRELFSQMEQASGRSMTENFTGFDNFPSSSGGSGPFGRKRRSR